MRMKYKKKHQKPLIHLSILFLFLIVLNSNFTSLFENIESNYSEDNYKEIIEDLSPELIVESPKNADYFYHLDFMPYGVYIYAPNYNQRYVGQNDLNTINFRLYDANGGEFSKFMVYVNDIESTDYEWQGDTCVLNISEFLQTSGIYNIKAQALSDRTKEWVTHYSILNVTDTNPTITPFYDDYMHTQGTWNSLDWNILTSNSRNYNYTIFINGTQADFGNKFFNEYDISFDYTSNGLFNNNLNIDNEIRLEIIDETGNKTINQFKIRIVADNYPNIISLDRNCHEIGYLTLWETEGFKLNVRADADEEVLDKIVIIANNLPIHTIFNAKRNTLYEIPVNINALNILRDQNGHMDSYLDFRAIAVTKNGRCNTWNSGPNQNMELRYHDYQELIEKTEDINSGRNIETLEFLEDRNSNINYSLTVVTDVLEPTTLTIAGSTGGAFEGSNSYWDHCYEEYVDEDGNNICEIFGGFDTDHEWHRGGMVFWVSVVNLSAVHFPMIVKIVYPEEIQPDGLNKIWNLQFMHWVDNCDSNERGWHVYENKSITENRDETLKDKGDRTIEVLIYSQGLYTFGMEPGDDYDKRDFFISSFPIGMILFSFGIAITTISLKSKLKIKKK